MSHDYIPKEVFEETLLQFLEPIRPFLDDPAVSDIMINGPKKVFVEKKGRIVRSEVVFRDNAHLLQIIDRIVSRRATASRGELA